MTPEFALDIAQDIVYCNGGGTGKRITLTALRHCFHPTLDQRNPANSLP
jgi:hypothetical protein